MTQFAVLGAGIIILAVSITIAAIGTAKKSKELRVVDKVSVNLGRNYNTNESRIPFSVPVDSLAHFDVKAHSGQVQIELKQTPFSTPPEANVSWEFPVLHTGNSKSETKFEQQLEPGTYFVALTNDHSGDSNVEVNLALNYKEEAYPKLYDVGIQMLIVAVPLIVAGILT